MTIQHPNFGALPDDRVIIFDTTLRDGEQSPGFSMNLQEKLRMATVIQAKDLGTDVVQVGSVVHVKDEKTGKSVKYTIVGSAEAKPLEHKLSNESPVGRALLGHKRNDTVAVKVPKGPARKLKITKIDVGLE